MKCVGVCVVYVSVLSSMKMESEVTLCDNGDETRKRRARFRLVHTTHNRKASINSHRCVLTSVRL